MYNFLTFMSIACSFVFVFVGMLLGVSEGRLTRTALILFGCSVITLLLFFAFLPQANEETRLDRVRARKAYIEECMAAKEQSESACGFDFDHLPRR